MKLDAREADGRGAAIKSRLELDSWLVIMDQSRPKRAEALASSDLASPDLAIFETRLLKYFLCCIYVYFDTIYSFSRIRTLRIWSLTAAAIAHEKNNLQGRRSESTAWALIPYRLRFSTRRIIRYLLASGSQPGVFTSLLFTQVSLQKQEHRQSSSCSRHHEAGCHTNASVGRVV